MDENTLNQKLRELIREITSLSPNKQKQSAPLIEATTNKVEGSFAALRIFLKYVLFDLEATRRERNRLQIMLRDQQSNDEN